MNQTEGRYAVEVIADSSGKFCGNALRFDSVDLAKSYAINLTWRWTSVRQWRVIDTENGDAVVAEG